MNANEKKQQQRRTNICLGTEQLPLVTSYYKDYMDGKNIDQMRIAKAKMATPPATAQILPEGALPPPDATTNRIDFAHPGADQCTEVYKKRLADLSTITSIHLSNSVILGPCGETNPFESCVMAAYKHPLENQRIMMKKYEEMMILGTCTDKIINDQ